MTMNTTHIISPIKTAALARRKLLFGILSILVLDMIAIGFNIPFLRQFLGLIITLIMPGFLMIVLFNLSCRNFWENLMMSLGLSIAFLEFLGLLLNQSFLLFKIPAPLQEMRLVYLLI